MPRFRVAAAVAIGVLTAVTAARVPVARAQTPDSIPRELALALLASYGGSGAMSLQVGRAHAGLPPAIIPVGGTVLGSLSGESQATTVLVLPQSESDARRMMRRHLEAAGFVSPQADERRSRGFVTTGRGLDMGGQFCRGDDVMMLSTRRRVQGGSYVSLGQFSGRLTSGWCGRRGLPARDLMDSLPIPPLLPPEDVQLEGGGMSSGGDRYSMTARLYGGGTSESIVGHYTAQLVADGWTATERTHTNGAAYQLLRRMRDGALEWSAALVVIGAVNDAPMHVSLTLQRH